MTLLLTLTLAVAQAVPATPPTLEEAQRCAALVHVASRADEEDEALFRADLHWSLAAADLARSEKLPDRDFFAAQDRARAAARAGDRAALAACLAAVPGSDARD